VHPRIKRFAALVFVVAARYVTIYNMTQFNGPPPLENPEKYVLGHRPSRRPD